MEEKVNKNLKTIKTCFNSFFCICTKKNYAWKKENNLHLFGQWAWQIVAQQMSVKVLCY